MIFSPGCSLSTASAVSVRDPEAIDRHPRSRGRWFDPTSYFRWVVGWRQSNTAQNHSFFYDILSLLAAGHERNPLVYVEPTTSRSRCFERKGSLMESNERWTLNSMIDVGSVSAILLTDGKWHEIVGGSFYLATFEFRDGAKVLGGVVAQGVSSTGARWKESAWPDAWQASPLTSIVAIRYQENHACPLPATNER